MTSTKDQFPIVNIPSLGKIKGVFDKDHLVAKFLNVPVGTIPERWRPPVRAKPWEGIHESTKPGFMPPQQTKNSAILSMVSSIPRKIEYEGNMNEHDCLGFYVFGGGFKYGDNSSPLYDFTELVKHSIRNNKPMVAVCLSYRLNYFGFLSSKELVIDARVYASQIPQSQRTWYDGTVGNWGLLDVVMGFQWVQDHINAFSGDKNMVTAMGQSAGSVCINNILFIPKFHGLFRRAILQSGGAMMLPSLHIETEGQALFDELCQLLNIPKNLDPLEKVARLRSIPGKDIAETLNTCSIIFNRLAMDGVLIHQETYLDVSNTSNYDPNVEWVMTGSVLEEASTTSILIGATRAKDMEYFKKFYFHSREAMSAFDDIYGVPTTDKEAAECSTLALSEGLYICPMQMTIEAILNHSTCQLTHYHFDRDMEAMKNISPNFGAFHGVDLFFIIGSDYAQQFLSSKEKEYSKKIQNIWIDFITACSPQTSDLTLVTKPPEGEFISYNCNNSLREAIVFKRDLTVDRDLVVRLIPEKIPLWWNSHVRSRERVARGEIFAGNFCSRFGYPKSNQMKDGSSSTAIMARI